MKNARILLAVLMIAGLARVAFSQDAAVTAPVVVEEEMIEVATNMEEVAPVVEIMNEAIMNEVK